MTERLAGSRGVSSSFTYSLEHKTAGAEHRMVSLSNCINTKMRQRLRRQLNYTVSPIWLLQGIHQGG